jgi:hypothetical protein
VHITNNIPIRPKNPVVRDKFFSKKQITEEQTPNSSCDTSIEAEGNQIETEY